MQNWQLTLKLLPPLGGGLAGIFLLLPRFPPSRKPAQNNNIINKLSQVEGYKLALADKVDFQIRKVIQDTPSLLDGPPVASDFL